MRQLTGSGNSSFVAIPGHYLRNVIASVLVGLFGNYDVYGFDDLKVTAK
jgi:hypothetical protein